jgi:CHAD domain-containing protein
VSATAGWRHDTSPAAESVYIASGDGSGDTITRSLQALLPTRHHAIARHRFTVLDTFDGRVRRSRSYLTRDSENAVAWLSHGGISQLALQLKEPVSFAWDFPEGPLQQRVASVIGPRRLLAQAEGEACGSVLEILDDRRKTVARLRIVSGQARLPASAAAWQPMPTLITVTGLRGYEDAYQRLLPVIESRPGLEPCAEGPLGVILGRVGAAMAGDLSRPRLDLAPNVRADIGARQIHLALVELLEANEPGLRADVDTEFLHDFRVAVRRTRSLLGQIRQVLPNDVVEHFSTEFSWLGRLTGPPRDLDVLVLTLRHRGGELTAADNQALTDALGRVQQQERERLVQALDGDRYRTLLSQWKAFLERPVPAKPDAANARASLASVVSRRAWKLSRRIACAGETIDVQTPAEELHRLRIDAKKLRYLVDVTPTFYDTSDLACVLDALKKLQRVLGDFNDADVQERRLIACGRALDASAPASVLMTLGRMAERCRQRREVLRQDVVEKLTRFRARQTRSACRRAFKDDRREVRSR